MRPKPKRRGFPLGLAAQAIVVFLLAAGAALALSTGWNPLAALTAASSAPGAPITAAEIIIVDGDTIRVAGERVRLVGFDAPETRDARCAREKELGDQATKRLTRLVDFGDLDFRKVPCSCPPGTEGTSACNYGRRCGILRANGEDVGVTLIREGLAMRYVCGATSCPPRKRPYC